MSTAGFWACVFLCGLAMMITAATMLFGGWAGLGVAGFCLTALSFKVR